MCISESAPELSFACLPWIHIFIGESYCQCRQYKCVYSRIGVLYLLYLPLSPIVRSTYLCVCVYVYVLEGCMWLRVWGCVLMQVCVSTLCLRTSSPIRLLCSVMGAQGGLRSAPWSVLIWLAFRYGPDTLPVTWKETQPPPQPSLPLFLSPFLSL